MTKEEYMQIREDLTKSKNEEDKPFRTVKVDYYESTNSDGERRIRVVTTTQKWIDPKVVDLTDLS